MQADHIADSLTSAVSHPVTVQVINQGAGIWGSVATGLITAGAAIAAVMLTHRFTRKREKQASEDKLVRERYFISTELIFLLEEFAEGCARVATDNGHENNKHVTAPSAPQPELSYSAVTGDWRVLPFRLMYKLRELPVLKTESDRTIDAADFIPPEFDEFFEARQYEFTRLGLKAIILARRLRKLASFPESRLNVMPWSAQRVLWNVWRLHRNRRSVQAILFARSLATFEIKNDMRSKASEDAAGSGENA